MSLNAPGAMAESSTSPALDSEFLEHLWDQPRRLLATLGRDGEAAGIHFEVSEKLHSFDPPADKASEQEVTYHGVEAIGNNILLAANEGRSYVDAVDVTTGKLLDRLVNVNKPCCVERIPGEGQTQRVLVSSIGDGTVQLAEVSAEGKMKVVGQATVGKGPKRVAFIPPNTTISDK